MDLKERKSKLEAFLGLYDSGISNDYVRGNIIFYAQRYKEDTGDYYRRFVKAKPKVFK